MSKSSGGLLSGLEVVSIPDVPPAVLAEVEKVAPIEGMSYDEVLGRAIQEWTRRVSFTPVPAD
ncbi:hypothetical protein AB0I53_33295, partial [Saccharopolyspora sp. NPDC050389]|uniref:hypothetical protein n=1 Tax=Saccharopolyspora sp. NPDC050389 TaxID=3155516 RepID=UPI0033C93ED1